MAIVQQTPSGSIANPARTLHIYLDGMTHRKLTVMDQDKRTPLYAVQANFGSSLFSSKPHMKIFRGTDTSGAYIGSASFHTMSSTIDLEIHGRAVELVHDGIMTRTHRFTSSEGMVFWKGDGMFGTDLKLQTRQKIIFARFDNAAFSMAKQGKLEIAQRDISEAMLDEIVISGLAMIEHERRRRKRSSGGGGGSG